MASSRSKCPPVVNRSRGILSPALQQMDCNRKKRGKKLGEVEEVGEIKEVEEVISSGRFQRPDISYE